jgi:hypothetical protein
MHQLPTKQEMLDVFDDLISGKVTREQISSWANKIMDDEDLELTDLEADGVIWDLLGSLGGCDSIAPDRPYLYGVEDFLSWRNQLAL